MRHAPLLRRLMNRKGASTLMGSRLDVRPPDLWPARDSLWHSTLRWLSGADATLPARLRTPLEKARNEFVAAMEDLIDLDTNDLLRRAQHARSLRELWHLRSELYTLVARRINQRTADERLARVNRYFPTRATHGTTPATESPHAQRAPA